MAGLEQKLSEPTIKFIIKNENKVVGRKSNF